MAPKFGALTSTPCNATPNCCCRCFVVMVESPLEESILWQYTGYPFSDLFGCESTDICLHRLSQRQRHPIPSGHYQPGARYIFMRGKLVLPPESTSVEAQMLKKNINLLLTYEAFHLIVFVSNFSLNLRYKKI